MKIIPSKYTTVELQELIDREKENVGEKHFRLVGRIEFCVAFSVALYILLTIIYLIVSYATFPTELKDILLIVSIVASYFLLFKFVYATGEYNLFKITLWIMRRKNIPMSPILHKGMVGLIKTHASLTCLYECVVSHPGSSVHYGGNGNIAVSYGDETGYTQTEYFQFNNGISTNFPLKEDAIDCSVVDDIIREMFYPKEENYENPCK